MHTQNKSTAAGHTALGALTNALASLKANAAEAAGMAEHTAGPWKWTGTRSNPRSRCYLTGKNDAPVAVALDGFGASAQDARLIAAAPELLEALEAVLDDIGNNGRACKQARAAIARAKGTA